MDDIKDLPFSVLLADRAYYDDFEKSEEYSVEKFGTFINFLDGERQMKHREDAQGYVFLKNGVAYVAFRGSSSLSDWEDGFNTEIITCFFIPKYAKCVHKGFHNQFKSIHKQLEDTLKRIDFNSIVFCGHSLGGVIASLAALWFVQRNPYKQVKVHTFGTPRFGNDKLDEYYKGYSSNITYWRVVNTWDPVPNKFNSPEYCHFSTVNVLHLEAYSHKISPSPSTDDGVDESWFSILSKILWHKTSFYIPRVDYVVN